MTLLDKLQLLKGDEPRLVEYLVDRLLLGQRDYGVWASAGEHRNLHSETAAEHIDAVAYLCMEAVRKADENRQVPASALAWLAHGERGASSEAIFSRLTGIPVSSRHSPPYDTGDLTRCRRLLQAVPEFKARLGEMRAVSTQWAVLVDEWDALCDLADSDAGAACLRMRTLLDGARK